MTSVKELLHVLFTVIYLIQLNLFVTSSIFVDNGLQQTIVFHRLPQRDRLGIQEDILNLVGLNHPPRQTAASNLESAHRKFMMDLYNSTRAEKDLHKLVGASYNNSQLDVIMGFVNHAPEAPHLSHERYQTFFFNFTDVPGKAKVNGAELHVYKNRADKTPRAEVTVEICFIREGWKPQSSVIKPQSRLKVRGDAEGWLKFNVTRALKTWTKFPSSNLGLYMRVINRRGFEMTPSKIGITVNGGPADKQSFLVGFFSFSNQQLKHPKFQQLTPGPEDVSLREDPFSSWKRNGSPKNRRRFCQLHSMEVHFQEINMDWILAPSSYNAFYCSGECSFPFGGHVDVTGHAQVQARLHRLNPSLVPPPCCVPTKLAPITLLYLDDNSNLILAQYKDMVARKCGCR
ncbi:hypothetical protein C0Q70_08072 [Pomacea canaliculata]|uniref:TGF-beta family profile domain-containing protein n=1 Tax=Pomacea canaliculata TaxID=400727 RepID=A0A2T7PGS3_POMCA|nr:bone morphogenetic protein 7-like [Pomacea canaliculata]PVD32629.1 hypothetical protein C0Q70_08072 [Pomacea canaliculata]